MGHGFRLDDQSYSCLMISEGFIGSPTPFSDDVNGVNATYN
jgi:hypothetical protein